MAASDNSKVSVASTHPGYMSRVTDWTYHTLAKPVLFMIPPDTTHSMMIWGSRLTQHIPPLLSLLRHIWAYEDVSLTQEIDGVVFTNPLGLSAGLDKSGEILGMIRATGFGFETCGSISLHQCDGNPRPWFHRLPKSKSLLVYAGLPNDGVDTILPRIQGYPNDYFKKFSLVVSVAKTNNRECAFDDAAVQDYCGTLRKIKDEPRISVLEINVSCPNAYGGEPFTSADRLDQLLAEVAKLDIKKPVWIKMPLNLPWEEFESLLQCIIKYPVIRGVTIANLNKDRTTPHLKDALDSNTPGNMSGIPTQQLGNELIRRTYRGYGDKLMIIGCGGVFTAEDAYRKIRLGASLIDMITAMIFDGPQVVGTINAGLAALLKRDGYSSIQEAIGADNGGFKRPKPMERQK